MLPRGLAEIMSSEQEMRVSGVACMLELRLIGVVMRKEVRVCLNLSLMATEINGSLLVIVTYLRIMNHEGKIFPPDRHTKQSFTETNHTRRSINTNRSPDEEHCNARNMYKDEVNKYKKKCVKLVIRKNF